MVFVAERCLLLGLTVQLFEAGVDFAECDRALLQVLPAAGFGFVVAQPSETITGTLLRMQAVLAFLENLQFYP